MILVLTLLYIVVLLLVLKLGWIKPTLFWKLSPLLWMVFLLFVLFFPLQFWAPAGYVRVLQPTVQIIPNVAGEVLEVKVKPNQWVNEGDVLYQIDPRPYQAVVNRLQADLELARIRYHQQLELLKKDAGRQVDVDRAEAKLKSVEAQLDGALYDLEQTTVRAPGDGYVTNVEALRPGARVIAVPFQQTMTFIDGRERVVAAQINQIYMRYIEPGQKAEVAFKIFPGRVFNATVEAIIPGTALGQVGPTGILPSAVEEVHAPRFVRLRLDDPEVANRLVAGDTGDVAIYSSRGKAAHVIRKVIIRNTAILNYIIPY
ncbi:MAG TPA: HlyD family secretion protein [Gammaproteobacteria bacterium]|nr:HlyD family secretion protein [Gammaproteobacteria bacterium]